jgi:uncharacterized membrane protein (DUF106 family)
MAETRRSGWAVGWEYFASVMLLIGGIFGIISGIVAIAKKEFYVVGEKWVFNFNVTTWGWIHLILGIVVLLAGIGILSGNVLARTVGVIVAAISAILNFMWLPYYPVWAITVIAIDVAVIWALTAHGRDIAQT